MTKFKEIKTKSDAELRKLIADKQVSLREFRFGLAGGKVKNLKEARNNRRDVARALTILNKKGTTI
jgi:ribosomal protein L29